MAEPVVSRAVDRGPWAPAQWVAVGAALLLLGVVLAVMAKGDAGASWTLFAILGVPGSLMVSVGVIAKAVQVGISAARE